MNITRRTLMGGIAVAGLAATAPGIFAPAIAQAKPVRIGILAPRSGAMGTVGECGIRAVQWAAERMNKDGGIAGRPIELVIEEETSPKDTIERFRRLVLQEKVDCVQGLISTGVSLGVAPTAEEEQALLIMWDGTTQDGVKEAMPKSNYVFRSTDNECEAVMASLLSIKYFKGKIKRIAGINPDYSYGRNNWEAFQQILRRAGVEAEVVAEQWPKVGTMDLTSHVAALKAAKPDFIFSSMLFADLPVFMKQGSAAGLFEGVNIALPAAGWQINQLKKEFMPENVVFGHNTLYFALPTASPLQKAFVDDYMGRYKEAPHWEADRAYFALAAYKAGVEAANKATGRWPKLDEIIAAIPEQKVQSLGGPGQFRKDKIAEQTFYQGLSTNKNTYDFPTLSTVDSFTADQLQKPPGVDFWDWIKTSKLPV
ncbi:MAG TPA: ABC transporter substrate-binding protein [Xanthobacteraceae bacterium]|jgi:branched-chain amino acid transport system substrate-binding protein|uniref:ABC transporter substrate-binding protein n=1 Tax=Roseixanthobacter finlandensis TaxID=3119922 RepID=UPI002C684555|nr:ABC transporter substrate-binding protein [Xanthobacteraceae bacterium]HQS49325.1 ABC transporter substrate-binding protein [Xanthobacteraceae bacterium]